jgi:hypothetical protein
MPYLAGLLLQFSHVMHVYFVTLSQSTLLHSRMIGLIYMFIIVSYLLEIIGDRD